MNKIEKLVRANIRDIKPYSSARGQFYAENKIYLDANENPFNSLVNRYPDPFQRTLKDKISEIKNVQPGQILLGNGSDEILDLICRAFCNPGSDNVIINPPTYGMYRVIAETNDIEIRKVLLNNDFSLNTKQIIESADERTKLVFICSPNNPTGNCFNRKDIEDLLNNLDCLMVIDEAYIDFSEQESWLNSLNKFQNLIIIQTFSKAWGMAGIRLGMCFSSEYIIEILNKIKLPYNVNQLTQEWALKQLARTKNLDEILEQIKNEKEKLEKSLKDLEFVKKVYPSDANFILTRFEDEKLIYNYLLDEGIIVRDRSKEPLCLNCLRISIGTPDENRYLINTLKSLKDEKSIAS